MIINPYIFGGFDPDAQAFITAANITDTTQQNAINTLVVDLKGYGVWSKMKAIYPFVGGTASTHKFNLKDPRDLDVAFRLVFNGGWTHSVNGITGNGFNSYANTFFNPNIAFSTNDLAHLSLYIRNNSASSSYVDFGAANGLGSSTALNSAFANSALSLIHNGNTGISTSNTNTQGFYLGSRTTASAHKLFKNAAQIGSTDTTSAATRPNFNIFLGAYNVNNSNLFHANRNYSIASIGDGLSDTEAANFYTAVQAFQTTLGRSVGPQTVSDPDAQAFVTAADIQDQVQAQAINTLTIDLKNYGVWTKMKAIYPFVGGTASTHKFNLKDPRDLDVAFRLVFNGGWTHSSTGATPNGTNGFANSYFNPFVNLGTNSNSLGYYTGSNLAETFADPINIGSLDLGTSTFYFLRKTNTTLDTRLNTNLLSVSNSSMRGFFNSSKQSSTVTKVYLNGNILNSGNSGGTPPNYFTFIAATSTTGTPYGYVRNDFRFAYMSDGLTDTDAANLYTAVQNYQVALSRQV